MQDARPHRVGFYAIKGTRFITKFLEVRERTCAGVLLGSFTMVGSQIREGNRTSILSETSHVTGAIALVGVNLVVLSLSLSVAILPWSKALAEILFRSFALVGDSSSRAGEGK
jgi:hypothetical protein